MGRVSLLHHWAVGLRAADGLARQRLPLDPEYRGSHRVLRFFRPKGRMTRYKRSEGEIAG